nr:hypothetical protein [Paraburkholderia sp. BCC1884]
MAAVPLALSALSAPLASLPAVASAVLAAVADCAPGVCTAAFCATAGADTLNAAAITHEAHDTKNRRWETSADLNTERNTGARDIGDVSGSNELSGERENSGKCGKRETKREPRRLRDKEIGNVVGGQRNMPEILSPCG